MCPQQFAGLITEDDFFNLITYHFGPEANFWFGPEENRQSWQDVRDYLYNDFRKEVNKSTKKIHEIYQKEGGCPGNAGRFLTFVTKTKSATEMLKKFVQLDAIAYSQ
jgi:hypothetical protein